MSEERQKLERRIERLVDALAAADLSTSQTARAKRDLREARAQLADLDDEEEEVQP